MHTNITKNYSKNLYSLLREKTASLENFKIMFILFLVAFAQIDWHDFVVVETVNFREDEMGMYNYSYLSLIKMSL